MRADTGFAELDGRSVGWDPDDVPAPEAVEETRPFAVYASTLAGQTAR